LRRSRANKSREETISEALAKIEIRRYAVTYETTTPLLGNAPAEGRLVSNEYVEDLLRGRLGEVFDQLPPAEQQHEIQKWTQKTITVFRRSNYNGSKVLCIRGDNMKGALKQTAQVYRLTEQIRGVAGALQLGLNVEEWFIPLLRNNKPITKPDDITEYFLPPIYNRPTAAVADAETLNPPATFSATLVTLSPLLIPDLVRRIAELAGDLGFLGGRAHGFGKCRLLSFRQLDDKRLG